MLKQEQPEKVRANSRWNGRAISAVFTRASALARRRFAPSTARHNANVSRHEHTRSCESR
jgi:hypothetical protein